MPILTINVKNFILNSRVFFLNSRIFFPKLKNLGNPLAGNKKKWLKNKPELFSRYLLVAKSGFFPTNFWQTRFTGVAETLSFSWVLSFSPWVLSFILLVILCNPWHFLLEMHQIFGENIKIYCFSSKTVFYGMFFDRIRYYQDILSRYFLKSLPKPWVFDMSYWIFLELWIFWSKFFQNVKKNLV